MSYKDRDKQRAFNRRWMAGDRARKREQRAAEVMQWYREQAENPTDPAPGQTPEQHAAWYAYVLSLPTCEELFGHLPTVEELFPDLVPLTDVIDDASVR